MPPNRKSELSADNLPTLSTTHSQWKLVPQPHQAQSPSSNDSLDYWSWPADDGVKSAQDAEAMQALFSAAHIEANLKQAAQDLQAKQQQEQEQEQEQEQDIAQANKATDPANTSNYWDMDSAEPKESEIPPALYQHLLHAQQPRDQKMPSPARSYWDWPTTTKEREEAGLQRVLDGQRARQLTSTDAIQANLVKQQVPAAKPLQAANDAYWVF